MRISDWSSDVCSSDLEFGADTMPQTSDNLAEEFQITREQADTFALASQQKYAAAKADGFFDGEIKPVTYTAGRKDRKSVVQGKSVSVRVDLGGRRIIKKKKSKRHNDII